jgi:hypothetical protein
MDHNDTTSTFDARQDGEHVSAFYIALIAEGIDSEAALDLTRAWIDARWGKPFVSHSYSVSGPGAGIATAPDLMTRARQS